MTAAAILLLVASLWIAKNFVLGVWTYVDFTRLRQVRNKDRTRRQFAEARNALMELAIAKDVEVDSLSFRFFYHIITAFMRCPDQYREVSGVLVTLFLNQHHSSSGEKLLAESRTWTPGFRAVVRQTADALEYVVVDYSWVVRFMFRVERKLHPGSTPFVMLHRMRTNLQNKEKPIIVIASSRASMYRMADNPLSLVPASR